MHDTALDIFNVFVLFTVSNQPEFRDLNSQPLLDRETTKTNIQNIGAPYWSTSQTW